MNAAEKMAIRHDGHSALLRIDDQLGDIVGKPSSYRVVAAAKRLLRERTNVCRLLLEAGYHPWPAPINDSETKVVV